MRLELQPASAPSELVTPFGDVARQLPGLGQAAVGVLGHGARHGQRARHQLVQRPARGIGRGHEGLMLAEQHAQADVLALLAFQALERAQAPGMGERDRIEHHRIGGLGAGRLGAAEQVVEQVEGFSVCGHPIYPNQRRGSCGCPLI
jgi:hypothetical protein